MVLELARTALPTATGFALVAAGSPLPAPALFTMLATWTVNRGLAWWWSALLAGLATVAGHLATYATFGVASGNLLGRWFGSAPAKAVLRRLRPLCARPEAWWVLSVWRWVGAGYAQVFWVLGAVPGSRKRRAALLAFLGLNDLLWAAGWTYGLVSLQLSVPGLAVWMNRAALAILGVGVLIGTYKVLARRRKGANSVRSSEES